MLFPGHRTKRTVCRPNNTWVLDDARESVNRLTTLPTRTRQIMYCRDGVYKIICALPHTGSLSAVFLVEELFRPPTGSREKYGREDLGFIQPPPLHVRFLIMVMSRSKSSSLIRTCVLALAIGQAEDRASSPGRSGTSYALSYIGVRPARCAAVRARDASAYGLG